MAWDGSSVLLRREDPVSAGMPAASPLPHPQVPVQPRSFGGRSYAHGRGFVFQWACNLTQASDIGKGFLIKRFPCF